MQVPASVILHPFIRSLLSTTSTGRMLVAQMVFLALTCVDIVASSFLCMTNTYNIGHRIFDLEGILFYFSVTWSIVVLILTIIKDILQFRTLLGSFQDPKGSDTYQKTKYHPYLNVDKTKVMNIINKMLSKARQYLMFHSLESGLGVLSRVIIISAQMWKVEDDDERNRKAYGLSFALLMSWWTFFVGLEGLTILPERVLILGLTIKKCILAVLEIILVSCFLAVPYVLILVKMSIMNELVIYQTGNESLDPVLGGMKRSFYAYHHMFRIMTLDNYHDSRLEENNYVLLSILYPMAITIFSLVILNMCIAKLSWLYKTIISSSQYHLTRERLIMKVFWDKFMLTVWKKLSKIHTFKS